MLICLVAMAMSSCSSHAVTPGEEESPMTIEIKSSAFSEGSTIPKKYSCDGENISPQLSWSNIPAETKSIAVIFDDPDAPSGVFVHWVIFNIDPTTSQLPESLPQKNTPAGLGSQGKNSFGKMGYAGPCPPRGAKHHYFFRIFALDTMLNLSGGASRAELDKAMTGHILARGQLMGIFSH
jgi:Raf kinase inhibitor-like YbhB/YbcL family protein